VTHTSKLDGKAILFDLDATLANSRPIYELAFVETFRDVLGMELDEHERTQFMGLPTIDFLMQYAEGEQLNHLAAALTRNVEMRMHAVTLFAGLAQILTELHDAGFRLGVVTSQNRYECSLTRGALAIDTLIRVWITTEDVKRVKPDPEPVKAALSALQAAAAEAVMVGDSIYDLKAGRAAGTKVGAAAWGTADLARLLTFEPDYVFQTPQDLRILLPEVDMENQAGKP
jgi:pyrophosphatase PpaX